jgi:UDP-2-acetamido-2-deoxy-ribo-hexuluronate aminotransferase
MVPMVDLKRQFQEIKGEIIHILTEILESSHYVLGSKVSEFENKVAKFHGVKEAVGVASGTDALHLAIDALGIGEGDEIITTPFTFFATAEAILYTGATPVFADIQPDTMNIDPKQIEAHITSRTKAILPVHLFGHPCDMKEILGIAKKHRLKVIEDCAQAFGAVINSQRVGSIGDAGCFSFYPSKNLGGYGDGGMVTIHNARIASLIRELRNHGSKGAYRHKRVGYNSRLDEVQAGVLLVKFKHIEKYNKQRRRNALLYNSFLGNTVQRPVEKGGAHHVYHQYTITNRKRDRIQQALREKGISSVVYYPIPLHLQEAMKFLGYHEGDFPIAEKAAKEVLSLPMYPELEEATIETICRTIMSSV